MTTTGKRHRKPWTTTTSKPLADAIRAAVETLDRPFTVHEGKSVRESLRAALPAAEAADALAEAVNNLLPEFAAVSYLTDVDRVADKLRAALRRYRGQS